jgi:hypothetical protein
MLLLHQVSDLFGLFGDEEEEQMAVAKAAKDAKKKVEKRK